MDVQKRHEQPNCGCPSRCVSARRRFKVLSWQLAAPGEEIVRFPKPEFEGDHRFDVAFQLLQFALSKTGTDYRIQLAEIAMNQERQFVEIEAGRTGQSDALRGVAARSSGGRREDFSA